MGEPETTLELNMETLAKLERDLDDLKKNFEQYFMGIQRIAPEREHVRVQGVIRKLKNIYTANTAVRFRLESFVAKFQSYSRYWNRILLEIEEGRYVRDRFKADMRVGKLAKDGSVTKAEKPVEAPSALNQDVDKLFKEYMMARIECSQPTEGLSKDKVKESLEKSVPQLKERYKGKEIQFRVVIEGGKAKLKAFPK
jgi:hypothetical protein